MPDLVGTDNLYLILLFVVPGLVAVYVRSRFISGRSPSHTENFLSYLALSILYYAITLPFIEQLLDFAGPWQIRAATWIALILVGPAAFGLLLGAWAQKEWGNWLAAKVHLSSVHVIPAAWDWRFSKLPRGGMFLIVTLTTGDSVAGFFGPRSFASSDASERDIYIEEEYEIDDGNWKSRSARVGILIPVKEIRYIEFFEP